MEDPEFTNDMQSLLRLGISFNASDAYPLIYETFINRMEGKRELTDKSEFICPHYLSYKQTI